MIQIYIVNRYKRNERKLKMKKEMIHVEVIDRITNEVKYVFDLEEGENIFDKIIELEAKEKESAE